MSRTLSKILVVCALVVVLPLMVVGTAFAAYYSINATVSIEVFVDQTVDGGVAQVTYKEEKGTVNRKLEVTDGHLKKVTFRASAIGYDFVGWYAGTYKAYANALDSGEEISYAITEQNAQVEMTDYQNLVAVFKAKTYTVSYDYKATPNDVLGSGAALQTSFVYGEALPEVSWEGHPEWTFDGWFVENDETATKYSNATFEASTVVLTGNWIDSEHITLTYLDDKGNELEKVENVIYENETYTLADVMSYQDSYSAGFVQDGYKYSWQDVTTLNNITSIKSDKDVTVQVVRTPITYTANIVVPDGLTLDENVKTQLTFSVENKTALDAWAASENWTTKYSFFAFDGLIYNNEKVESLSSLIDSVVAANPTETTSISLSATVKQELSAFNMSISYGSSDGVEYANPVYQGTDKAVLSGANRTFADFSEPSMEISDALGLKFENEEESTFYAKNSDGTYNVVNINAIMVTIDGTVGTFSVDLSKILTLNDFIDSIYNENLVVNGALSVSVMVQFR